MRAFDRVKESSVTVGTGNFTLGGAAAKFRAFSGVVTSGERACYLAEHTGANEWEIGVGIFTSPSTLSRASIITGSNGSAAVNFSAGTKEISLIRPAEGAVLENPYDTSMTYTPNRAAGKRAIAGGSQNAALGDYDVAIGGSSNTVQASATHSGVLAGSGALLANATASVVVGGQNAVCEGTNNVVLGGSSTTTSTGTSNCLAATGGRCEANSSIALRGATVQGADSCGWGPIVLASNMIGVRGFKMGPGARQGARLEFEAVYQTTTATPTEILTGSGNTGHLVVPSFGAYAFALVIGALRTSDGACWAKKIEGLIKRDGGGVVFVGTPTETLIGADAGFAPSASVMADATFQALKLAITGIASTTIEWSATGTLTKM